MLQEAPQEVPSDLEDDNNNIRIYMKFGTVMGDLWVSGGYHIIGQCSLHCQMKKLSFSMMS